MTTERVALVGCGAAKLGHPAPARRLYSSALFRKSLELAERTHPRGMVRILSARFGLVRPEETLPPYEHLLTRKDGAAWAEDVVSCLPLELSAFGPLEVTVLAGVVYADPLVAEVQRLGLPWVVHQPMRGMGIGQRLGWLTRELAK